MNLSIGHIGTLNLQADVLVIGGGPAGTWAALTAAAKGAKVILADKGYCGSSGATAPSGTGVWYVQPDDKLREEAKASRYSMGGKLAEHRWMDRVLDRTYENMNRLGVSGYPFPLDEHGNQYRRSLQGPEYMRLMRRLVKKAGVKILDHSPALELLADEHGVAGATGVQTQSGEGWSVQAGAVVIATGGCAFLSRALGCNVLTGDGYLFAAEAGASLSGMEFSNAYAICPTFSSVTKTAYYSYASFYYEDGSVVEGAGSKKAVQSSPAICWPAARYMRSLMVLLRICSRCCGLPRQISSCRLTAGVLIRLRMLSRSRCGWKARYAAPAASA